LADGSHDFTRSLDRATATETTQPLELAVHLIEHHRHDMGTAYAMVEQAKAQHRIADALLVCSPAG
jgi:hypothetical protein